MCIYYMYVISITELPDSVCLLFSNWKLFEHNLWFWPTWWDANCIHLLHWPFQMYVVHGMCTHALTWEGTLAWKFYLWLPHALHSHTDLVLPSRASRTLVVFSIQCGTSQLVRLEGDSGALMKWRTTSETHNHSSEYLRSQTMSWHCTLQELATKFGRRKGMWQQVSRGTEQAKFGRALGDIFFLGVSWCLQTIIC